MRGVVSAAGYVPYHRLDRSAITAFFGSGGGRGTRAVAAYDEDTTTMGQAAADLALRSAPDAQPDALWFCTSTPAYLDKTNAAAIHAALRLDSTTGAHDFGGALRSGAAALRTALASATPGPTLVVAADMRDGQATGADEATAGDGAAAVLVGDDSDGPLLAEYLGGASHTLEVTERWRIPGGGSRSWEERFAAHAYAPAVTAAWQAALADVNSGGSGSASGLGDSADASGSPGSEGSSGMDRVDRLAVTGLNARSVAAAVKAIGAKPDTLVDPLINTVGNTGTAHPALLLCSALEDALPGQTIAVVTIADGVEVIIVRATDAIAEYRPVAPVQDQIASGGSLSYGRFLTWRKMVAVEPPNRPPPNRPSSSAALRRSDWKYGFTGSRDRATQMLHLPPARVSERGGAADDMEPAPMANHTGIVASFTIDRLAYSPSPPTVFAIVDFDDAQGSSAGDGGDSLRDSGPAEDGSGDSGRSGSSGRAPLELTDVEASDVHVGMEVVPTFRRLYTADEIHNYFWKARPLRTSDTSSGRAAAQ